MDCLQPRTGCNGIITHLTLSCVQRYLRCFVPSISRHVLNPKVIAQKRFRRILSPALDPQKMMPEILTARERMRKSSMTSDSSTSDSSDGTFAPSAHSESSRESEFEPD
mmetsp:Transcript_162796/g.312591  ORF Transcript_162796/g.312591 Transcript_162796/m.312591 type:complete len:109 (+) Transcript_162796:105-431(+)